MKKVYLALAIVLIAATGCTPTETPESVVKTAISAWNAGDVDTLKSLYSDEAVVCFPDFDEACPSGAEEIGVWIEGLVALNFVIEVESLEVDGDTTTVMANVWADPSRELGIAPLETIDVYTVQNGVITSQTSTLTEESQADLMAAMAAAQSASVIIALGDAFNNGDIDSILAIYSDDAVVNLVDWGEVYTGTDELRGCVEELVALHFTIEYETPVVEGDTISAMGEVWADPTRELGIAPLVTKDVFIVENGQVLSQTSTLTEESGAALQSAMALSISFM